MYTHPNKWIQTHTTKQIQTNLNTQSQTNPDHKTKHIKIEPKNNTGGAAAGRGLWVALPAPPRLAALPAARAARDHSGGGFLYGPRCVRRCAGYEPLTPKNAPT